MAGSLPRRRGPPPPRPTVMEEDWEEAVMVLEVGAEAEEQWRSGQKTGRSPERQIQQQGIP